MSDELESVKTIEFVHRCKCCLDDKELKDLWDIHEFDGEEEVYGFMLTECFALPWQPAKCSEFICELCVSRLREAVHFKQEILATEEVLVNETSIIKTEEYPTMDEDMVEDQDECQEENAYEEEDVKNFEIKEEYELIEYAEEADEFQQVEYLDLEDAMRDTNSNAESLSLSTPGISSQGPSTPGALSQDEPEAPKRKWPKKKKKSERTKQYKQYTSEDLRQAIQDVRGGVMSCADAAIKYGVPKKTLAIKVNRNDDDPKHNDNQYKLIEEVKALLLHTTALPFKTKTTRYYCFYCSTDGPYFEEPEELREHTITNHQHEIMKIEIHMRPQWLHEIIKLDVENLQCRTCHVLLPDWNYMFRHLAEVHDLEFDQAISRAVPYALDSDLKCVLCHQAFHNFGHLDAHMNGHYSNYICYECGDTFLSVSRLDKHLNVHKVGKYPCPKCDKMFSLEKYRSKHISLVHNQDSTVKCLYCPEKFVGLFQRHIHVTKHHKEKVKTMTCEFCGKCYTWKPYFLAHLRRRHGTEKNYHCKYCNKSFLMRYELNNHIVRHTKEKKFLCGECGESFAYKPSLSKHLKSHKIGN